jgi:hypothetical protein
MENAFFFPQVTKQSSIVSVSPATTQRKRRVLIFKNSAPRTRSFIADFAKRTNAMMNLWTMMDDVDVDK